MLRVMATGEEDTPGKESGSVGGQRTWGQL